MALLEAAMITHWYKSMDIGYIGDKVLLVSLLVAVVVVTADKNTTPTSF